MNYFKCIFSKKNKPGIYHSILVFNLKNCGSINFFSILIPNARHPVGYLQVYIQLSNS